MITFRVDDMTCGHCARTITEAVKAADQDATVQVDLPGHLVHVEPAAASPDRLAAAIREAGYGPEQIQAAPNAPGKPAGGCCGCR